LSYSAWNRRSGLAFAARYSVRCRSRALSRMAVAQRHSPALPCIRRTDQVRRLPFPVLLLPRDHQYYAPLRLPLRSRPLHRHSAYRARRSQSTRELAPRGSHCWGRDGSLLFPRWLCQRSAPSTPLGSSGLLLQVLHPFHGLRLRTRDSAPSWSPYRRGDIDAAGFASCCGPLACTFPVGRLDPALRRPALPERRRATTKVPWYLLWPDFHRLVIVSFRTHGGAAHPGQQRCSRSRTRWTSASKSARA
jgi:hypothetical protein